MKATNEIVNKLYMNRAGLAKIKWNEVFENEEDLVDTLKGLNIVDKGMNPTMGYEYLKSFKARLCKGIDLTPKQMTQLKRLSASIAYEILCVKR